MLTKLKQLITSVKVIEAEVVRVKRSEDRATFMVTFREIGKSATFTHEFDAYYDGRSTPKPHAGTKATVHVNRRGEVVYAGNA